MRPWITASVILFVVFGAMFVVFKDQKPADFFYQDSKRPTITITMTYPEAKALLAARAQQVFRVDDPIRISTPIFNDNDVLDSDARIGIDRISFADMGKFRARWSERKGETDVEYERVIGTFARQEILRALEEKAIASGANTPLRSRFLWGGNREGVIATLHVQ